MAVKWATTEETQMQNLVEVKARKIMGSAKHVLPILNYNTVPGRPDLVESFSTPV